MHGGVIGGAAREMAHSRNFPSENRTRTGVVVNVPPLRNGMDASIRIYNPIERIPRATKNPAIPTPVVSDVVPSNIYEGTDTPYTLSLKVVYKSLSIFKFPIGNHLLLARPISDYNTRRVISNVSRKPPDRFRRNRRHGIEGRERSKTSPNMTWVRTERGEIWAKNRIEFFSDISTPLDRTYGMLVLYLLL